MSEKLWNDCCKLQVEIMINQWIEQTMTSRKLYNEEKEWIYEMPKWCSLTCLDMINHIKEK